MKTLEQIAEEYKSETVDGRDLARLAEFFPFDMLKQFGLTPKDEYNDKEFHNSL